MLYKKGYSNCEFKKKTLGNSGITRLSEHRGGGSDTYTQTRVARILNVEKSAGEKRILSKMI